LRSTIKRSGELELSLVDTPVPEPAPDEVVIKVEAAPINRRTSACCSAPPT
jgi:NADPH:quinone reductase-like Zn-dependent oxidoreductase